MPTENFYYLSYEKHVEPITSFKYVGDVGSKEQNMIMLNEKRKRIGGFTMFLGMLNYVSLGNNLTYTSLT